MKKNIIILPLIISIILFILSLQLKFSIHNFDSSKVVKNIKSFSSSKYQGRLAGTLENDQVALTLKGFLEQEKLKPFKGNFYDGFTTDVPNRIEGNPFLTVTDSLGNVIKEFEYGIDYKEDMLNFKTNSITFNKTDEIALKDSNLQAGKNSKYYLFYVPHNNTFAFRSSFINDSVHDMYIMITDKTLADLKEYITEGYNVNCFVPFDVENKKLNNVAGFIQGVDPLAPPIVISSHFDHVGTDLQGNTYGGALDNASGTAFVMELIKYLKSIGKPERNILFIFFNAEELGCKGSTHFATEYSDYLKESKILNIDMIGSNNNLPLSIMGGKKDTIDTPLVKELSLLCSKNNIRYSNLFEDSSDHEAFRDLNIDAVTFCDYDITKIHTPNDKVDYINTKSIDTCFKVVASELITYAYGDNYFLIHNNNILRYSCISSIILSLIFLGFLFMKSEKKVNQNLASFLKINKSKNNFYSK
ncbi:MAG: Zn-dependent exopeptidase M28 [Clostridiaceae bacterium]|nr:Zn-dependent exopeptidase M28 [Clostridiaceae bacterium]